MKTNTIGKWTAVGLSVLMSTAAYRGWADGSPSQATAAKPEKNYTGMVDAVNPTDRTLEVKGLFLSKKFSLGSTCAFTMLDQPAGAIGDVRPGQKVTVSYQDAHGVLIADRVQQKAMADEGMVKAIDPAQHTLTLHLTARDMTFRLPDDCAVVLRGGKSGSLADIQTGNHVTVTYEMPDHKATARQIAQTSQTFSGSITAIDANDRTVKAKTLFGSKEFHLGDNCAIVVNGKTDGNLSDLKIGGRFAFSYDDVNGVNVANRIGSATARENTEASATQPVTTP